MKEIWRDVPNFEGLYQISNYGNIKSLDKYVNSGIKNNKKVKRKGRILKQYNKQGYLQISLTKNHKRYYFKTHRLVASAFIENPNNLPQVNHKDENALNNHVDNLEWCTAKYNCNYGSRNKNIRKNIRGKNIKVNQYDINNNFIRSYNSIKEASEINKCSFNTIRRYCSNITKDDNYIWRYADE